MNSKTILFCGGGTAGHVMPNLAIIEALGAQYRCVYAGGDGMEKDLCADRNIPFFHIDTVKLRRDAPLKNIGVPFKLGRCVKSARRVLDEVKPDLVFSKGGFAALPVVLAAKNIPVLAHESDMSPGLVTRLSKRRADRILCAFATCAAKFKNGELVGTPLSKKLYAGDRSRADLGFSGLKPVLLIMGGSSGAASLNAIAIKAVPELLKTFDIVHITGKRKPGAEECNGYKRIEFCNAMPDLYAAVDIAVTRAGANALSELIALKIPAIAVPLEKASRGDQLENARYFDDLGAVKMLRESDITERTFAAEVRRLYAERFKYKSAMSALSVDGTARICEIIREELGDDA